MPAYSFSRDLFELNMGQFSQRYGGPISGVEFAKMKAAAISARVGLLGIKHSTQAAFATNPSITLTGKIITEVGIYVIGGDATFVAGTEGADSYMQVNIGTTAGQLFILSDLEITDWSAISAADVGAGSPTGYFYCKGYTPPTTNP